MTLGGAFPTTRRRQAVECTTGIAGISTGVAVHSASVANRAPGAENPFWEGDGETENDDGEKLGVFF